MRALHAPKDDRSLERIQGKATRVTELRINFLSKPDDLPTQTYESARPNPPR